MRQKSYWLILMVLCLGILNHVGKAETGEISLDQAINLALQHDFQVRNGMNQAAKTNLGVKVATKSRYPQADFDYTLQHELKNNETSNQYNLRVTETFETGWSLYGSKVSSTLTAADWEANLAQLQLKMVEANTINKTTALYLQVLKLTENLRLNQLAVKNLEKAATLARERLKLGKITKSDELKIQNDLASAQYELEKCQSDKNLALLELSNQLGKTELTELKLAKIDQTAINQSFNYSELRKELLKRRLEVKEAEIGIEKVKRVLAQQKNEVLPDLSLGYCYEQLGEGQSQTAGLNYSLLNGTLTANAASTADDEIRGTNQGQSLVDLNLSWNFNYGSNSDRVKQTKLDLDNAVNSREQVVNQVKVDLEKAIAAYELATKKIAINQQAIAYYQKNLSVKQLELKLGTTTQLEVALVEQELLVAQINVVSSQYDQLIAAQNLKLAAGLLYTLQ